MNRRTWVLFAVAVLAGCGKPGFSCSNNQCECASGETCSDANVCGTAQGCTVTCDSNTSCSATCGASCTVICNGDACTATIGAGSQVSCNSGSCSVTCSGPCTAQGPTQLSCGGGTVFDRNANACS